MALLNEHYIFVIDEEVRRGVSISEHPVESGLDITDNVKRNPKVILINGQIVGKNATQIRDKIEALHHKGQFVKYVGQNVLSKALITEFDTSHPNSIYGGCAFSMEIKEIRIAKSPLVVKKAVVQAQVTKQSTTEQATVRTHTVKRGDTLWALAAKYYGSGAKYPTIYEANKDKIKNPNIIQVGWVLVIPSTAGAATAGGTATTNKKGGGGRR